MEISQTHLKKIDSEVFTTWYQGHSNADTKPYIELNIAGDQNEHLDELVSMMPKNVGFGFWKYFKYFNFFFWWHTFEGYVSMWEG